LLPANEVDRAPMGECEDPRACFSTLGDKARSSPPDREECLLHRVLGEGSVADDADRKAVGDCAEAVVELRERAFVAPCEQRDEGFVREVGEVTAGSDALAHGGSVQR
jgi:hypothetical protein